MIDQLENFLVKGYAVFLEPDLIDLSVFNLINVEEIGDAPELELLQNVDLKETILLQQFADKVSKNYVEPVFKNFKINRINAWNGVDLSSMHWHNDKIENFDFSVLYYYDDTSIKVGGKIEFQYPEGEVAIYPRAGNLIFINQDLKFRHRASRSTNSRRVASIEYIIL
jgi:hypothetical protein